jgi:ornithine decarboxylase antizyme 1
VNPWRPRPTWVPQPATPRPRSLSCWTRGLYSGFDAARASWEFPEGTCAGYNGYPSDPVSDGLDSITGQNIQNQAVDNDPDSAVKICFSAAGLGGARTTWEAVLWQDRLYVSVTGSQLADGSKRAFVSLLEYAEEELGVSHVVACLDKLHHDNKNVIRNFLFLGFQPIAPGHEYQPSNPNVVCFLYTI